MAGALSPLDAGRHGVTLGVVVPMLNEAAGLPALLPQLQALQREGAAVLVVDGGSRDNSCEMVQAASLPLLRSARGRARQMNAGAAAVQGDVLLFLHADSQLPPGTVASITDGLRLSGRAWGRFDVRIIGRPRMLRVVASLMNWRSRLTGVATGDQGLFMTRTAFAAVGGFPEQPLMEDIDISIRLRRLSPPLCLRGPLLTSGRRWETRGVWRTIWLMWRLRLDHWRGVPVEQLAERYR